jgi:hypothetical protein
MMAELCILILVKVPRDLYIELHNRGTNACGTVQENCIGLPKDIDKKALKRGEMEVWQLPPFT